LQQRLELPAHLLAPVIQFLEGRFDTAAFRI
jgi:hypothetical protein